MKMNTDFIKLLRMNRQKPILEALMKKPEKPLPTDCCGSGCERCVYDIYVEQLKQYRAWKKSQETEETGQTNGVERKA